jgi:hypothetical protein
MKALGVISTTALFLLLGTALPAFAQEEQRKEEAQPPKQEEQAKPARQEEQAKPPKQEEKAQPAKQQEQAKPVKQEEAAKPAKQEEKPKTTKQEEQAKPPKQEQQAKQEKQAEQAKPVKQEEQAKPPKQEQQAKQEKQAEQAKPVKQQDQGKPAAQQHAQRTPAEEKRQRAEPALRLSARGSGRIPDDRFRANFGEQHVFVINQPVVVSGYSRFEYGGFWFGFVNPWPVGWYYTDDVYVDYIDGGYYLCNPYYPGARLSISVVI